MATKFYLLEFNNDNPSVIIDKSNALEYKQFTTKIAWVKEFSKEIADMTGKIQSFSVDLDGVFVKLEVCFNQFDQGAKLITREYIRYRDAVNTYTISLTEKELLELVEFAKSV